MKCFKKLLFATAFVAFLASFPGCNQGALPNTDHSSGPKAPAVALKAAREVFQSRFARKGGSYYTIKVITHPDTSVAMGEYMDSAMKGQIDLSALEKEFHPQLLRTMELIELKGLRTRIEGHELSEADRLNGITWKGTLRVETESERRRDLDLIPAFKDLVNGEPEALVEWTEKELVWRPSEVARSNLAAHLARSRKQSDELSEEERMAAIWATAGEFILKSFLEGYASTEWCDWWSPDGNAYQVSEIVVREGKVEISTLESVENVLVDQESVALFVPGSNAGTPGGLFGTLFSAAILETQDSFLLRPNIEALARHDLLQ